MRTARAKRTQKTQIFRILPHRAPVRHFQKTTTRPIPAAIVLGTAVVATALPLPSSTPATATGTAHVTRAYTDKSTHEPGKQATITAETSTGEPSTSPSALTTVADRRPLTSRRARMSRAARLSRSTWAAWPRGTWSSSPPPPTRTAQLPHLRQWTRPTTPPQPTRTTRTSCPRRSSASCATASASA